MEIAPHCIPLPDFSALELNHDVHDKSYSMIYGSFQQWWHYLEGSGFPIDVVTDHLEFAILFND